MRKKTDRDLALKILAVAGAVRDALEDLLGIMFIIYQPKSVTVAVGETVVFTVVAMNVASYQWEVYWSGSWHDSSASGYDTDTLTFTVTSGIRHYKWRCKLTDADGDTIYTDVLTVN